MSILRRVKCGSRVLSYANFVTDNYVIGHPTCNAGGEETWRGECRTNSLAQSPSQAFNPLDPNTGARVALGYAKLPFARPNGEGPSSSVSLCVPDPPVFSRSEMDATTPAGESEDANPQLGPHAGPMEPHDASFSMHNDDMASSRDKPRPWQTSRLLEKHARSPSSMWDIIIQAHAKLPMLDDWRSPNPLICNMCVTAISWWMQQVHLASIMYYLGEYWLQRIGHSLTPEGICSSLRCHGSASRRNSSM